MSCFLAKILTDKTIINYPARFLLLLFWHKLQVAIIRHTPEKTSLTLHSKEKYFIEKQNKKSEKQYHKHKLQYHTHKNHDISSTYQKP
jgi:hypothetical protein